MTSSSFLYDASVVVLVGPEKQRFNLHKGPICRSSAFFRAALNGDFKEAEGVVKLPEQCPSTFKYFVYWLYIGKLRGYHYPDTVQPKIADLEAAAFAAKAKGNGFDPNNSAYIAWSVARYRDAHLHELISLYCLADALQVVGLKDQIISLLIEVYGTNDENTPRGHVTLFWRSTFKRPTWMPSLAASINQAWDRLLRGSLLHKVLMTLFCDGVDDVLDLMKDAEFDYEFLTDCLNFLLHRPGKNEWATQWRKHAVCEFHEHDMECTYICRRIFGTRTSVCAPNNG